MLIPTNLSSSSQTSSVPTPVNGPHQFPQQPAHSEWSKTMSSTEVKPLRERGSEVSQTLQELQEAQEPGPSKKPRLPRIAEACIRARRKNTRSASQTGESPRRLSPGPRYAAASPSSLQNLLRTDAPPSNPTPAFDTFATDSEPPQSFTTPVSTSNWSPYVAPQPRMTSSFPPSPAPPPPPPPSAHPASQFVHHSTYWADHNRAHTHGLVAPVSDVRNSSDQEAKTTSQFAPDIQQRPNSRGKAPAQPSEPDEEDEAARGVGFLSLNAGGNPIYVGPSSGFSWARMVLGGMTGACRAEGGKYSPTRSRLDTKSAFDAGPSPPSTPLLSDDALASASDDLASRVFDIVFQHVQSQFCFMDWIWLRSIYPHRVKICQAAKAHDATKTTKTGKFMNLTVRPDSNLS
ncbi:hypothetical protein JCM5350_002530 [Sporobolomyces pararoseus]